ncbi:hypothetical protein RYA05_01925 [Pseudomonas syringae pv. actinidiae]|nr:hypothetical protein [Pseudomonas syringae pv. actinidiae]
MKILRFLSFAMLPLALNVCGLAHAENFRSSSSANYGAYAKDPDAKAAPDCDKVGQMIKGKWQGSSEALFALCSDGNMWVIDTSKPDKGWEKVPAIKAKVAEAEAKTDADDEE